MSDVANSIRVLLVDDHELFRQGVSALLGSVPDIEIVGQAGNGLEALDLCSTTNPDVVLMDINMPVCGGLEATRIIKHQFPHMKILILTVSNAEEALFDAIKSGASGYVLKNANPTTVIDSIRRIHAGEPVIPSDLAMHIIAAFATSQRVSTKSDLDTLTERELEVLRKLSTGATNREIAACLYISENTVRNHVRNILSKLHLNNRAQAAAYALSQGFTNEESVN